jgi:hypothetical protein
VSDVAQGFAVRVMVTPVWSNVELRVDDSTTVQQLKRDALQAALKTSVDGADYVVKFRGALVSDESATLGKIGVVPHAPFIILPARRQPVR